MPFLASFCNLLSARPSPLAFIEDDLSGFRWVRFPAPWGVGATGLALTASDLFVVTQNGYLAVCDRDGLKLRANPCFEKAYDAHSVMVEGERIFVVGTGADAVFELSIRAGRFLFEKVAWRPDPDAPAEDRNHLNSLTRWGRDIFVSGFGTKAAEPWYYAAKGFVKEIPSGRCLAEDIYQPHSLLPFGNDLFLCESARSLIRTARGDRSVELSGYTRGLCAAKGKIYVGTSKWRHNYTGPGEARCKIICVDPVNFRVEAQFDFGDHADEIYDIVHLEERPDWELIE